MFWANFINEFIFNGERLFAMTFGEKKKENPTLSKDLRGSWSNMSLSFRMKITIIIVKLDLVSFVVKESTIIGMQTLH